jgi:carbonic anhydrase
MRSTRSIVAATLSGLACWSGAVVFAAEPAKKAGADNAMWQSIFSEPGRRMEIDRLSIKHEGDKVEAWGRIVFERGMPDAVSGTAYRVLEALNRYDCNARSFTTLKRVYRKDESKLLREEEPKSPAEMPVRTGTLDDKVLRVACRPTSAASRQNFESTVKQARAAGDGEAPVGEVKRELLRTDIAEHRLATRTSLATSSADHDTRPLVRPRRKIPRPAVPEPQAAVHWSYGGAGGPDQWAALQPEYKLCAEGNRQSPIDIRETIKVDLTPIEFAYRPSQFRIIDTGRTLLVAVSENRFSLLGKRYELVQIQFHQPSEERIDGKGFAMAAHLVHRSDDNKLAIVAVMLEQGAEHPLIQTLWNHLPLERNEDVYPPGVAIDLNQLLPEKKQHFAYMGSLTTPPCTEGVLWLVMKNPVQVSAEQIAIFSRLYQNNARPLQPSFGRLIKESR